MKVMICPECGERMDYQKPSETDHGNGLTERFFGGFICSNCHHQVTNKLPPIKHHRSENPRWIVSEVYIE